MGIILENYILFNNIFYFIFNFYGSIVDLQCCMFHMYSKVNRLYIYPFFYRLFSHIGFQ